MLASRPQREHSTLQIGITPRISRELGDQNSIVLAHSQKPRLNCSSLLFGGFLGRIEPGRAHAVRIRFTDAWQRHQLLLSLFDIRRIVKEYGQLDAAVTELRKAWCTPISKVKV